MARITPISQFGGGAEGPSPDHDCLNIDGMLADMLDNTLAPEDQAVFDRHVATCAACSAMLADARRGAAWLEMLRPFQPVPPAGLVDRILAETSVRAAADAQALQQQELAAIASASLMGTPPRLATSPSPSYLDTGRVLPFRMRLAGRIGPNVAALLQTRNAMTAAMAFFSITFTLNLLGVHVTALRARDLTPSSLRRNASETNARVIRYYESLRVVYELESRVHDIQHANDADPETPQTLTEPAPAETPQPEKKTAPPNQPAGHKGRSSKENELPIPNPGASSHDLVNPATKRDPASAPRGPANSRPLSPSATYGPVVPVSLPLSPSRFRKGATA